MQQSTAEAEHELLQLWSSVEKERDAMLAQRAQHAQRRAARLEARQTKLAPLSCSPLGGGGAAGGGGGEAGKGAWQRLHGEEAEGEAAASAEAAALEAGAAGVRRRMELAVQALDDAEGRPAAAAAAASEQRGLLPSDTPSSSAAGAAPESPLRVPPHLPRVRTSSAVDLQLAEVQLQTPPPAGPPPGAAAAAASSTPDLVRSSSRAGAASALAPTAALLGSGEWGSATRSGSQQLQRLPSRPSARRRLPTPEPLDAAGGQAGGQAGSDAGSEDGGGGGGGEAGGGGGDGLHGPAVREPPFWRTLVDMALDIRLVAAGPEGAALRMALWLAFFNQVPAGRAGGRGGWCARAASARATRTVQPCTRS